MVVAIIHQRDALVFVGSRIGQTEFSGTDGVGFHADAEDLGFDTRLDFVEIKRFF